LRRKNINNMIDKIYPYIHKIIKKTFSYLTLPQQKSLALTISAFFDPPSFSLYNIASKLPLDTSNRHKHKHLIRFLDKLLINDDFWKSYITTIFLLPHITSRKKFLTLLIDATTLKDDVWILSASISYENRAVPIYMELWEGVNQKYDYWARVIGFVRNMRKYLPDKFSYVIIADRGFQGERLPKEFKKLKLDYIIRIGENYHIKTKNGEEWRELSLLDDGKYNEVVLGKTNSIEGVNVIVSSIKDAENKKHLKWYLMSSIKDMEKEEVVGLYAKRMWIEESFKDLKGKLRWEEYTEKLPKFDRIKKMVIISGLSYGIQLSLGSSKQVVEQRSKGESIIRGLQNALNGVSVKVHKIMSIFLMVFIMKYQYIDRIFN